MVMTEAKMQEEPQYAPGTFCWVELGTSDSAAGKKFYTELFGWSFDDHSMGPGMVYTMLKQGDKEVGAMYELMPEMRAQGIPPHWLSYISVTNADESAVKVKANGGTLMKEPFDVLDVGRMAVVMDPTGAGFAIWQAGKHKGAGIVNVPNSFCWNELGTTDTAKAGEFYSNVFGWEREVMDFGPMQYTMFNNNGRPNGGMFGLTPEMGPIPPHWLVYFAVEDCDAITQKANDLGGKTMKPPDDIPEIGRFSILLDPQGAAFAVIKLINPPE
jgi:predicted enzyme related to lactoylglutathione lyase